MINSRIEHTLLRPDITKEDVVRVCEEATQNKFRSIVVMPQYVRLAKSLLNGNAKVVSVIDFPMGGSSTLNRILQAKEAISDGADEIDVPLNVSNLKSGQDNLIKKDLQDLVMASKVPVKVIIEISLLSKEEVQRACVLVIESGAAYLKTNTGTTGGVKKEDVEFIRETVRTNIKVKAAGGIKTFNDAMTLFDVGADLVGTSNAMNIVKGSMPVTYLSGSIYGIPKEDAAGWRKDITKKLDGKIWCIDPLRKPYEVLEDKYKEYWKDIVETDKRDIDLSDFIILKFDRPSAGTMMEQIYAYDRGKPVYVLSDKDRYSPWVKYHSTKIFNGMNELIDYVVQTHVK